MMQPHLVQPPRTAVWLVSLFTFGEAADSILGDLLEEFSHLAAKSGVAFARRWYWRQVLKSIVHLIGSVYRVAPWSTSAAVVGGFLLRRLVAGLPERAIFALIDRYQIFEFHFETYKFLASTGIDIGHLILFLFVGFVVALGARGREMAPAMTLALIYAVMAFVASLVWVTRTGDAALLWRLTWCFADSFALVVGAAIVRTWRTAPTLQPADQ
jgi:hypothetical protein